MSVIRCLLVVRKSKCFDFVPIAKSARLFSVSKCRRSATEQTQPKVISEDEFNFDKDVNIAGRIERRSPAIKPFVKELFLARFNRELLAFPEHLNKEENELLDKNLESIRFALSELGSVENVVTSLRATRILNAPAIAFHGGLASNITERVRMLEELSANVSVARLVAEHWSGLDCLYGNLSKQDSDQLVPAIIEDGRPISMCLAEPMAEEPGLPDFSTSAILQPDGTWRLKGVKHYTIEDSYKIVIGVSPAYRVFPFLIEPNAPGITYQDSLMTFEDTPAIRLIDMTKIHEEDDRAKLCEECLRNEIGLLRLYKSVIPYSCLKNLIPKVIEYVRSKYCGGKNYSEFPIGEDKVADALLTVYTCESMAFFTAGLHDGYQNPDTHLEMAMCRIFASERSAIAATDLLTLLRNDSLLPEWQKRFRDIADAQFEDWESNDGLHIYTALTGLQHAGKNLAISIKKMRNPLFNPMFIFRKIIDDRYNAKDKPQMMLFLKEHLHPSLEEPSKNLEYCVYRLQYATETLLARYGKEIEETFREASRLSMAATDTFAMSAAIARASRSYCVGLHNASCELHMANQILHEGKRRVKQCVLDIEDGEYLNFDATSMQLGQHAMKNKGSVVEHAIARTFW